jgi:hypothetical protein
MLLSQIWFVSLFFKSLFLPSTSFLTWILPPNFLDLLFKSYTVEPSYNDIGLCVTSFVTSDILWCPLTVTWYFSVITTPVFKVKVPRNRPEGPDGGRGIALLFLDLGATRGWVVSTTLRPLYPRERPGTHCTGGWVGPRAGLDVCEKSRPHRDLIPGPSSP